MQIEPKKISSNVTMYSVDPIIYVVSNFISDQECDAFIDAAKANEKYEHQMTPGLYQALVSHNLNNHVHEVSKRLSILTKISVNNLEEFLIEENNEAYGDGKVRFDSFDQQTPEGRKKWFPGGQRIITTTLFLNDSYKGGSEDFPEIKTLISPQKGDVLVVHNCLNDGPNTNIKSQRSTREIVSGSRWTSTSFFRQESID